MLSVAVALSAIIVASLWRSRKENYVPSSFFHMIKSSSLASNGTKPELDYFKAFSAPASGPRGFVTMGFDHHFVDMASSGNVKGHKWFLGGSTAALRFVALIASIVSSSDKTSVLKEHFTEMTYNKGDTPQVLSPMMSSLYEKIAPPCIVDSVVSHPYFHLAVMVCSFPSYCADWADWRLKLYFARLFIANLIYPGLCNKYYSRICFYTGNEPPPFINDKCIKFEPLTADNFYQVLRATTCIPFVSERVTDIDGVGSGLYYDGAICDYHLNVKVHTPEFLMLFLGDVPDHKVKGTFFDALLPWRQLPVDYFKFCCRLFPTQLFVQKIPGGQVPDVSDWFRKDYIQDPSKRKSAWRKTYGVSVEQWPDSIAAFYSD
jgi:hypothetical protein